MTKKSVKALFDATAYDKAGDKLGGVKEIFVDDKTGQPTFVEVNHGLFGLSSSLVPLRGHRLNGDELHLAFSKDRIKDAPSLDSEKGLNPQEQKELYAHYGLESIEDVESYSAENTTTTHTTEQATFAGQTANTETAAATERRTAATDDDSIVRSEEQLTVNKDRVQSGEARIRKYVVTETETGEVPVTREEVQVKREPISAEDAANYNGKIGEDEASVILHEERVTVQKETVPVEKISLEKTQVQDTARYSEEVRKERVEFTDDVEKNSKK
ncbi:DUF2382 domain-containing protein [Corynebacterium sp. sy017]|uniref:DUF2382 domain-containing protein n=1 Tax=unclassified Corynebacterium TaxID=2624378 RepID=UPI001185A795|nr:MULTISPECIES: PRC and DUF2382 domain-containing protein [unclassified Corynebacterium]MBP3088331.1 DUF2382 domain-containing protein [Corynebacterium sp. sy017]TSD91651.1 DUF2382 domain-containing protein [Corynebacterium sp. SY003]